MTFGLAVLGTGRIGGRYIDVVKATPGAHMAVVAEPREEQVTDLRQKHPDVEFVADFREAIAHPDVHVVLCTLPHWLHKDAAIEAARAGKHIYTEKPMAAWLSDAREMMDAARQHSVKLMTAHTQRYYPAVKAAQELVASRRLGDPVMAHDVWHFPYRPHTRPEWMLDRKLGGGMGQMAATHQLDRLLWIFGADVVSASAKAGPLTHPEYQRSDDTALCFLRWRNGFVATLSMCAWRAGVVEYGGALFFTQGMARFSLAYGGGGERTGLWVADTPDGAWRFEEVEETDSLLDEFSAFIASLERGDNDTPVPQSHGLRVLEVMEAAEESSRMGREVVVG
ncbi:MAG: Gfo/Idh/MocA family protein [Chloroflexota bacterium]